MTPGTRRRTGPGPRRPAAGFALLLPVLALAASGCGIRSTSVPVDAGPAPSRVTCAQPSTPATAAPGEVGRTLYLVCGGQIAPVRRAVRSVPTATDGRPDAAALARALVAQLELSPRAAESSVGFDTAVPDALEVLGARPGDPAGTLRLNQAPDELPSYALGQIVCTLAADATVSPDHSVVLGGPDRADELRRYSCTSDLRTSAYAADTAGIPVR
ncbi:hypothetical protein VSR01_25175 [Actinacidiphila sp. DG2A-62]|jgi:hypothetical protein|uniref:hypothetical protein n=1 Tax=Actinacidiphila sp. DG2A-62 TaxID=3108821 RepID=UPI002DBD052F|nr:hypothetical protein [Actinacidiphila sp. DG2A-62]MEC3996620.1 hypothetical protein [Actinacidiphila sp. DG2A-62]